MVLYTSYHHALLICNNYGPPAMAAAETAFGSSTDLIKEVSVEVDMKVSQCTEVLPDSLKHSAKDKNVVKHRQENQDLKQGLVVISHKLPFLLFDIFGLCTE